MSGYGHTNTAGSEQSISVFSPDGRLLQVEFAREAIRRGSTVMAIKSDLGVLILADRRVSNPMADITSIQKIHKIDKSITMATVGLTADGRALVDIARRLAQSNRITYEEEIPVKTLAEQLTAHMQSVTHNGNRPYGVGLIITDGKTIYEADPSGSMLGVFGTCVGAGAEACIEYMSTQYRPDLTGNEATKILYDTMRIANPNIVVETTELVLI